MGGWQWRVGEVVATGMKMGPRICEDKRGMKMGPHIREDEDGSPHPRGQEGEKVGPRIRLREGRLSARTRDGAVCAVGGIVLN